MVPLRGPAWHEPHQPALPTAQLSPRNNGKRISTPVNRQIDHLAACCLIDTGKGIGCLDRHRAGPANESTGLVSPQVPSSQFTVHSSQVHSSQFVALHHIVTLPALLQVQLALRRIACSSEVGFPFSVFSLLLSIGHLARRHAGTQAPGTRHQAQSGCVVVVVVVSPTHHLLSSVVRGGFCAYQGCIPIHLPAERRWQVDHGATQ